ERWRDGEIRDREMERWRDQGQRDGEIMDREMERSGPERWRDQGQNGDEMERTTGRGRDGEKRKREESRSSASKWREIFMHTVSGTTVCQLGKTHSSVTIT